MQKHISHDLVIIGRREGHITGDASAMAMVSAMGDRVVCVGELEHGNDCSADFVGTRMCW